MPSLGALGNLDIWTEVLQYFYISLHLDSESEIKEKRGALLRIALLSPSLTTPALDILWRDMSSLEPITRVIDSKATSPDDQFLIYQDDGYGGYWTLRKPLTSEEDRDRAYEYLSRIRHLEVAVGVTREMGLWSTLSMSLGISPSTALLPKLQSLSLNFSQAGNGGAWINAVHPLLSGTLTTISYNAPSSLHAAGIDTLQAMFRSQSLGLTHITYRGYPSSSLLRTCLAFNDLETLKLNCEFGRSSIQRYTSGVTITEVLEKLQNLKDLEIDLRVFPFRNATDPRDIVPSPFLQRLSITGDASGIGQFLLDGVKSSSVRSLSIAIFQPNGLVWKVICDRIVSNFPHLHSLSLRRAGSAGVQQILMQDLSALISRSTMQSLELDGIPHCLTEANMSGLLDCWPTLHTLAITNDYTIHFSASLLIRLSQANHLRRIKLPLDLTFLQDALSDESVPISHSLVQELTITNVSSSPPSLGGKIELARNLLMLFPMLERIVTHSSSSSHQAYLGELEKLVASFRGMIITYLRRKDFEKRQNQLSPSVESVRTD